MKKSLNYYLKSVSDLSPTPFSEVALIRIASK